MHGLQAAWGLRCGGGHVLKIVDQWLVGGEIGSI
jgi:hypothetical protein